MHLPKGFVRYNATEISIQVFLRYYGTHNFLARNVDGYLTDEVLILTEKAAKSLFAVQEDVMGDGYSLVVYDAYRPVKAVQDFVSWTKDYNDTVNKEIFYPYIDKKDIIPDGFVANKSAHSRGSTVDLTLIPKGEIFSSDPVLHHRILKDGEIMPFYDDLTVDAGTSFDLFDDISWYTDRNITDQQYDMRMYLQGKMEKHGFASYLEEWWHFTLKNEPFPDTYFDFDVQ